MHYYNIYVILAFILILAAAGAIVAPAKALLILKTARWSRHVYYSAITSAGFFLAQQKAALPDKKFLLFFIAGLVLINLLFAASMILNNVFDTKIDSVNKKENALNYRTLEQKEYFILYFILLGLSLALSALMSVFVFAAAVVIHLAAYVYSCPPARIKNVFPFNTLLIAFSTFLALILGFIIPAGPKVFALFPWKFGITLFFGVALAFNTKDVNDYEGDKKYGVQTLMTLLGPKKGKFVIALLAAAGYLLVSFIAGSVNLVAASLVIGLATFFVIILPKKRINEALIFILFFIYAAVFIFLKPGMF